MFAEPPRPGRFGTYRTVPAAYRYGSGDAFGSPAVRETVEEREEKRERRRPPPAGPPASGAFTRPKPKGGSASEPCFKRNRGPKRAPLQLPTSLSFSKIKKGPEAEPPFGFGWVNAPEAGGPASAVPPLSLSPPSLPPSPSLRRRWYGPGTKRHRPVPSCAAGKPVRDRYPALQILIWNILSQVKKVPL